MLGFRRLRGHWRYAGAILVLASVVAMVLFVRGDGDRGVVANPEQRAAEDDADWLALIEEARQRRSQPDGDWPEGRVQDGVTVIRSCGDVPPEAILSDSAIEYSPNERHRRLLINYTAADSAERYQLILYDDGDLSGCSEGIRHTLTGADVRRDDVDAHICSEMARMAASLDRTDPTLRQASPAVASAYLEAFCGNGAPDDSWPESKVQTGVIVVRSCTDVPGDAQWSDGAVEFHPDGDRRRVVVNYLVVPSTRYQLILYEGSDFTACGDDVLGMFTNERRPATRRGQLESTVETTRHTPRIPRHGERVHHPVTGATA